jgi:hypothetical protein
MRSGCASAQVRFGRTAVSGQLLLPSYFVNYHIRPHSPTSLGRPALARTTYSPPWIGCSVATRQAGSPQSARLQPSERRSGSRFRRGSDARRKTAARPNASPRGWLPTTPRVVWSSPSVMPRAAVSAPTPRCSGATSSRSCRPARHGSKLTGPLVRMVDQAWGSRSRMRQGSPVEQSVIQIGEPFQTYLKPGHERTLIATFVGLDVWGSPKQQDWRSL